MSDEPTNPWLFHRDEFDLLEEEYNEIFQRHETVTESKRHALEEEILQEQMETEDATEAELAKRLGTSWTEEAFYHEFRQNPLLDEHRSLRDFLFRTRHRDPLYEKSLTWAMQVFRWARQQYEVEAQGSREIFRVYANVYLVPIKISFALSERGQDDAEALIIAEKELELAGIYLERVEESLRALQRSGIITTTDNQMLTDAKSLAAEIHQLRDRFAQRNKLTGYDK